MPKSPIAPDTPLYNSRIIDTYIKLLKRKYSFVDVDEVLEYAGMKAYEVADQGHWFSQTQIDRFHAILTQKDRKHGHLQGGGAVHCVTGGHGRHAALCLGSDRTGQSL
jgi:hypothetical protein